MKDIILASIVVIMLFVIWEQYPRADSLQLQALHLLHGDPQEVHEEQFFYAQNKKATHLANNGGLNE